MEAELEEKKWKKTSKKIKLKKWKTTSKKKWKTTSNKIKNGRRPEAQLKKSTLIGCDIIVN